jgi:uracil-DNA glycosylase family protein
MTPARSRSRSTAEEAPGAERYVPANPTLDSLRDAAQKCRGCELYRDATQAVVGEGPTDAKVMLVGEQPGDKEDLAGKPFVGPAGQLLVKALDAAGMPREAVYRTNVVKHFRFSEVRGKQRIHKSPDLVHMTACMPWLLAELSLVGPQGVVLLGATAGKAILGRSFKVTQSRGQLLPWPTEIAGSEPVPDWLLATTHPSAVLRSRERDTAFEALVSDLRVAAGALS